MLSLFRGLARLPLWLLHAIGAALGWITYWASPSYRRRFDENVRQAGVAPADARPAIAAAGRMVAEAPFLWLRPAAQPIGPRLDWAGRELIEQAGAIDLLLVPCGGGGLLSGSALAARALAPSCRVVGVEPELAEPVSG